MESVLKLMVAVLSVALLGGCDPRKGSARNALANFGKVNDALYRGAQPDLDAMRQLNALGVRSVINLRMPDDVWAGEAAAAAAGAMTYTNIPLPSLAAPTDEQITRVLAAILALPKPVFVHCQFGCDRTGMVIACYRIQQDRWGNAEALKEAEAYGLSPFEVGKRAYILQFAR